MPGWKDNSACILGYLALFQSLAAEDADGAACVSQWKELLAQELATPPEVTLAPQVLRERFQLDQREFLLTMAALALEMDSGLRAAFRSRYGLSLPTVEYGLQLIAPLCPSSVDTLAELAGRNALTGLLLTTSEQTAYALERPLILCRSAFAFLTGLSLPDCPGISPLLPSQDAAYLPIHEGVLPRVREWFLSGAENPLYLQGTAGTGRRTLLVRACGGAVCLELEELAGLSGLDRDHLYREAAILSILLSAPVCALASDRGDILRELTRFCDRHTVPLTVVTEQEGTLEQAQEVIRLPDHLSPEERNAAWHAFLPHAEPDSVPGGSMGIGALAETAKLALRSAALEERGSIQAADTLQALRQRGGALAYGIHYAPKARLEDMVLPAEVREQLREICMAAQCGSQLSGWGLPQQREGVTAVFHGPSGTGKTMAANAIARELGMPLLRADLSQIMDKYVGETEKHLGRLLQSARENRCVLLFDEADSLFGKRASVSTGHDKFANLSTSFLLQEIEQYDGVALLSTNLLSNFDDAFLRRLQYIVRFTLPDAALREQLWRRALPEKRLEGDIPFAALAQAELSPARINSVARAAAVAAVTAGRETIQATGLVQALRLELEKNGKALPRELSALVKAPAARSVHTELRQL